MSLLSLTGDDGFLSHVCHTEDGETHTGWGERFEHPTKTWACATQKQFTMQMVAVAIAKATWNWVRGKCEEAMREVLGAGRGVQAGEVEIPAMAAEAGREMRQGAESDKESDVSQPGPLGQFAAPEARRHRPRVPLSLVPPVLFYCSQHVLS